MDGIKRMAPALLAVILIIIPLAILAPTLQARWAFNQWALSVWSGLAQDPEGGWGFAEAPVPAQRAQLWLGVRSLRQSDYDAAEGYLLQAGREAPMVGRYLGQVYEGRGQMAEAVAIWEGSADQAMLKEFARRRVDASDYSSALLAYQALYRLEPIPNTLSLATHWKDRMKDPAQAEQVLREALAAHPYARERKSWLYELGQVLRKQERWEEAIALYQGILTEYPQEFKAHVQLGWVYRQTQGVDAAIAEFLIADSMDPTSGDGAYAVAQALTDEKRYAEADEWYRKALEKNPQNDGWFIGRANTARAAENWELAYQIYQEQIRLHPEKPSAYFELAWWYRQQEQPQEAVEMIEKALRLATTPNEWYFQRAGAIYEWTEQMERAVAMYQRSLQINPQNSSAAAGLKRIQEAQSQ